MSDTAETLRLMRGWLGGWPAFAEQLRLLCPPAQRPQLAQLLAEADQQFDVLDRLLAVCEGALAAQEAPPPPASPAHRPPVA